MASTRSINEKHKKAIDEMRAEVEPTDITPGIMSSRSIRVFNNGVGDMEFQEFKQWGGGMVNPCPTVIPLYSEEAKIVQSSRKGAVVYVGPNVLDGPNNCAWVLAWSINSNGYKNQIYAETGPSALYAPESIKWDAIEANLEESSTQCYYHDSETGAVESASIDPYEDSPRAAAVFDVDLTN